MLELDGLSKRYGEVVALQDLSFAVEPGQILGFVGPNGAGKTTTMRIVLGLLIPDAGEVRWQGQELDASTRRRIGYMPEERGLYPKMRVGEQLEYFAQLHAMSAADAAASAESWLDRLGVAEREGDAVEELSLGNQQRVQLAAALVHRPDMLVLDEPFSGLDPVGVEVLSDVLTAEARERQLPVIFSSHQLELVERLCDAVAIIKDGTLVASGGVDELRDSRSAEQWEIEVAPGSGWAAQTPGVHEAGDGIFTLDPGTDPQRVLDAARAAGAVTRFARHRPSLAELFRDAVTEPGEGKAG